jgi:hypothetical protein
MVPMHKIKTFRGAQGFFSYLPVRDFEFGNSPLLRLASVKIFNDDLLVGNLLLLQSGTGGGGGGAK